MRVTLVSLVTLFNRTVHSIALLRPVYSDTTQLNSIQLNSTSNCRHVHSVNNCHLSMNVVTQL